MSLGKTHLVSLVLKTPHRERERDFFAALAYCDLKDPPPTALFVSNIFENKKKRVKTRARREGGGERTGREPSRLSSQCSIGEPFEEETKWKE